jgi:ribosomal protein S18 acetylase RimI-like enzyme
MAWSTVRSVRRVAFVVVAVHDDPRRGEICIIAVDPDYQSRGIGLTLVNFATDPVTGLGLTLAEIGTGGDPGNPRPGTYTRHVYEKAGFTVRTSARRPAASASAN